MALFLFHFFDGETFTADDIGLELPSVEHAYVEAEKGARAMWSELLAARCDPRRCRFCIQDADGNDLFDLHLSELLDNCVGSAVPPGHSGEVINHALRETHQRASRAREDVRCAIDDVRRSLSEFGSLLAQLDVLDRRPLLK